MKKNYLKRVGFVFLAIVAIVATVMLFIYFHTFYYSNDSERRKDVSAVEELELDLLLLTMYSQEEASTHPFEYYMAYSAYKAQHVFENLSDITDYVEEALGRNGGISKVYTFFDPAVINDAFFRSSRLSQQAYQKSLKASVAEHSEVEFRFVLPSHSLEYWSSLDEDEVNEILGSYLLFCNEFQGMANVKIYFFGHLEWLIANPGNYVDSRNCNSEMVHRLTALTLADDEYLVKPENIVQQLNEVKTQIALADSGHRLNYDLSPYNIVFFGDSVIGNYSGPTSIPGVVASLSGARAYNCAVGGQSASASESDDTKGFEDTLDVFLKQTNPPNEESYIRVLEEAERFYGETAGEETIFLIAYGLNDYFSGINVDGNDAYDINTYKGALRKGIMRLQEAFPEAKILLATPNFAQSFDYGQQETGAEGGRLEDYVSAVTQLAAELDVPCVNIYSELGINKENWSLYSEDECHLNEQGRFCYGVRLIEFVQELESGKN